MQLLIDHLDHKRRPAEVGLHLTIAMMHPFLTQHRWRNRDLARLKRNDRFLPVVTLAQTASGALALTQNVLSSNTLTFTLNRLSTAFLISSLVASVATLNTNWLFIGQGCFSRRADQADFEYAFQIIPAARISSQDNSDQHLA